MNTIPSPANEYVIPNSEYVDYITDAPVQPEYRDLSVQELADRARLEAQHTYDTQTQWRGQGAPRMGEVGGSVVAAAQAFDVRTIPAAEIHRTAVEEVSSYTKRIVIFRSNQLGER